VSKIGVVKEMGAVSPKLLGALTCSQLTSSFLGTGLAMAIKKMLYFPAII
jgi:hypothetical protein